MYESCPFCDSQENQEHTANCPLYKPPVVMGDGRGAFPSGNRYVKLSAREFEVAKYACATGKDFKEIAKALNISLANVGATMSRVYQKAGVWGYPELMFKVLKAELILKQRSE